MVKHRSDSLSPPSGLGGGGTGEACAGDGSACQGTGRAAELSANPAPAERQGCRVSALEPDSVQIAKDYFVIVARLKTKKNNNNNSTFTMKSKAKLYKWVRAARTCTDSQLVCHCIVKFPYSWL